MNLVRDLFLFRKSHLFTGRNLSTSNIKKGNKNSKEKIIKENSSLRISKFIARCGICSRREAESWILMVFS